MVCGAVLLGLFFWCRQAHQTRPRALRWCAPPTMVLCVHCCSAAPSLSMPSTCMPGLACQQTNCYRFQLGAFYASWRLGLAQSCVCSCFLRPKVDAAAGGCGLLWALCVSMCYGFDSGVRNMTHRRCRGVFFGLTEAFLCVTLVCLWNTMRVLLTGFSHIALVLHLLCMAFSLGWKFV